MGLWEWAALALWGVVGFVLVGASHLELEQRRHVGHRYTALIQQRNRALVAAGAVAVAAGIATALAVIL